MLSALAFGTDRPKAARRIKPKSETLFIRASDE
jgi:hypothetical protein